VGEVEKGREVGEGREVIPSALCLLPSALFHPESIGLGTNLFRIKKSNRLDRTGTV
jgi:hypothetical protein